jgi:vacuolar protein sorting-associated protein 26
LLVLSRTPTGKIYFLLVRIKIKHMEIAIIKRESTGSGMPRLTFLAIRTSALICRPASGPNLYNESETITKYEIMDGAPVRGTSSSTPAMLCLDS